MGDGDRGLEVHVADESGRPVGARELANWLAAAAPRRARGTVNVAIVSDARVRALNRRYRGKDAATDVLSFPAFDGVVRDPRSLTPFLGDIVIARGVAKRQARAARHDESTELRTLALHGLLHLLGYDHEHDDGRMRRIEARLRRRAGLDEGLIERAAAGRSRSADGDRGRRSSRARPGRS
jgi:probable rRNA maturation factor